MEGIRIIELPKAKMVSSGYIHNGDFSPFDSWFSEVDKKRKDPFYPRDFMWFDPERGALVWYYALFDETADTNGFEVVDFEGGLYAVAISKDGDNSDGERVYNGIKEWVKNSGCFELDERPGHYCMFHISSPPAAKEAMGYHQMDIHVPIKIKNTAV